MKPAISTGGPSSTTETPAPLFQLLAEGYGLTPKILATLDQPETSPQPGRPDIPPPVHTHPDHYHSVSALSSRKVPST
ncbi:hypothetical protein [Streptomyces mirabilis]|uniref:hypothetical protein n=1 Tax=Streptomyces mirabilis TaxID=68239 RepID=UPI0033F37BA1